MMTSDTSAPSNPALVRLSLITRLPSWDAFSDASDPHSDPVIQIIIYLITR